MACPEWMSLSSWPIPPAIRRDAFAVTEGSFEIGASYQLEFWQVPTLTSAVVHTGAGPSVIRADMSPERWTKYASRAPPRAQVSNVSGQLLKLNAEASMTIFVGGKRHGV